MDNMEIVQEVSDMIGQELLLSVDAILNVMYLILFLLGVIVIWCLTSRKR